MLDLFSGCGGISLGFEAIGFAISAAIEIDPVAADTHATNFFRHEPDADRARHRQARDIVRLEPSELSDAFGWANPERAIDVITGGPPCQAYARVGRAKLREVAEHPTAFLRDPRSNLYLRFLAYVEAFAPVAILMENVPDALNFGGHNVAEETCEVLEELGYVTGYTLLNSANYGVPQMRERMFLLAYCKELRAEVSFPSPTNWLEFPKGYEGTRRVALRNIAPSLFDKESRYVAPPIANKRLPAAVSAREALADLPPIREHLNGGLRRGARRFTELSKYRDVEPSPYARLMREWPGFESSEGIHDHVIRSLPRDYQIFRAMKPGDQYPEAYAVAERLFQAELKRMERKKGSRIRANSKEFAALRKSIVPPYDASKFPNKWRKMEADLPARTLMAHLGKDSYSHIHYDSEQARTISVREAARLQSFPDGFAFCGTMNPAFRQIGNAVPPLLSKALASHMMTKLQPGTSTHDEARSEAAYSV